MKCFSTIIAALLVANVAACGLAPKSVANPHTAVELSGRWVLDRQASDDVRARLKPVLDKQQRRWQRDVERARANGELGFDIDVAPPAGSTPASEDASTFNWMQRQYNMRGSALIGWLSPARQLTIQASTDEVMLLSDKAEGTRRFHIGESSALFSAFGAFEVESKWDKGAFLIESTGREDNRARLLERFVVRENGSLLEEQLTVRAPIIGKQKFKFVYRRDH